MDGWHTCHHTYSTSDLQPALYDTLTNASIRRHSRPFCYHFCSFLSLSFIFYSILFYSFLFYWILFYTPIFSLLLSSSFTSLLLLLHISQLPISNTSTDTHTQADTHADTHTDTDTDSTGLMTVMEQKWWTWLPSITLKMIKDFSMWTF